MKDRSQNKYRFSVFLLVLALAVSSLLTGTTSVAAAATGFQTSLSVSKKKIAVNVGFYQEGNPNWGSPVSEEAIKNQLKAVKKFADTVRFYGSAGELSKAYKIAYDMGFQVVGTAWLSGNAEADKKELKALISHCNNGYVTVACVGSETLMRGDLTGEELIKKIKYVRKNIKESKRKKIAVTTADDLRTLLADKAVCKECDVLMVNTYPFWGGTSIKTAAKAFAEELKLVQEAYPKKEIIVSETGWPTKGNTIGKAKPSGKNSATYFTQIRNWSKKNGIVVFWFDAADEPWKGTEEGSVGSHWGLMDKNYKLKSAYKELNFFKKLKLG